MLFKHSLIYLFARGIPGIINFLAIAVYTRLLLPEEYGQYTLVIAWVGLADMVLFQWLRLGLLRFLPQYQEQRSIFLSTIIAAFLILVALTGLLGLVLFFIGSGSMLWVQLAFIFILLVIQAWYELNLELSRSQLHPGYYGLLSVLKAALSLSIGWYLAMRGWGAGGLLVGLAFGFLVPGMISMSREWRGIRLNLVNFSLLREVVAYGTPLTATFALSFIVSSSDRILLGFFQGAEEAGLYAVGYDLAQQSLVMLMMIVNLAAYPLAVKALQNEGFQQAQGQLKQNAALLFLIALPSTTGMMVLSPNIADVFLGSAFQQDAARLIPLIAIAALVMGIKAYYFDLSFQLGKRTVSQVWVVLTSAIVNLGLNLWWIPLYGLLGAAYATLIAYAVGLGFSIILGRRIFPVPFPGQEVLKIGVATVVMLLALFPFLMYRGILALILQVGLGGAVYFAVIWLFNVMGVRQKLGAVWKKRVGER